MKIERVRGEGGSRANPRVIRRLKRFRVSIEVEPGKWKRGRGPTIAHAEEVALGLRPSIDEARVAARVRVQLRAINNLGEAMRRMGTSMEQAGRRLRMIGTVREFLTDIQARSA